MTQPAGKAPWLLARLAQGAIAVAAVADVFRVVAHRAYRLHPTKATLSTSGLVSMAFVYLMTAAAVLFLVWFSRTRRNAHLLSPGAANESGVWAVAAWLIPVVNLWVPRRLVLDVQRASSTGETTQQRPDVLVNTWWAAWVAHQVIAAVSQFGRGTSIFLLLVAEALNLAAAILVICVIQHITALQSAGLRATSPVEPLAHA